MATASTSVCNDDQQRSIEMSLCYLGKFVTGSDVVQLSDVQVKEKEDYCLSQYGATKFNFWAFGFLYYDRQNLILKC